MEEIPQMPKVAKGYKPKKVGTLTVTLGADAHNEREVVILEEVHNWGVNGPLIVVEQANKRTTVLPLARLGQLTFEPSAVDRAG